MSEVELSRAREDDEAKVLEYLRHNYAASSRDLSDVLADFVWSSTPEEERYANEILADLERRGLIERVVQTTWGRGIRWGLTAKGRE